MQDSQSLSLRIHMLIQTLTIGSSQERKQALVELEEIGKAAVPEILQVLNRPSAELRREGAFLLGEIGDPSSIPALMDLLEDNAFEVRWRASESLIKMDRFAVMALLKELTKKERFSSTRFLEGAHHILHKLNDEGYLGPSVEVLKALEAPNKEELVPWAAEKTLEFLMKSPN